MLIIFDSDIIDNRDSNPFFYQCLNILMQAYREGLHLIYIPANKTLELLRDSRLTQDTESTLKHYHFHEAKQANSYFNYFSQAIRIINLGGEEKNDVYPINNVKCRNIRIDKFIVSGHIQPTILIGEDDNDAEVYRVIGESYIKNQNVNINLNFFEQAGGGQNTFKVYRRIFKKNQQMCLCILDSDRRTPLHQEFGSTAKRVIKEHDEQFEELKNYKCHYYVLDNILEIENIFPKHFYSQCYGEDINKKDLQSQLEILESQDTDSVWYFDYKSGVKCFTLTQKDDLFSEYWKPLINEHYLGNLNNICNNEGETCLTKDCCIYKPVRGYGTKTLEKFLEYYNTLDNPISDIIAQESSILQGHWEKIGREVASWGCSSKVVKVI